MAVYLLCPIMLLSVSKILLEQIIVVNVAKILANSGRNYSFSLKDDFSEKLKTITFVYLVGPIILQHFKQILTAIKVAYLWHELGPNCPFFPE